MTRGESLEVQVEASRRLELLAATANDLLTHTEPKQFLQLLFDRLASYCGLEVCFSYWIVGDRLQLAFATGVPAEIEREIEWLDFGEAVCGTVAQEQCVRVAENIQENTDAMTAWVRSMGVQAYCCHPLIAQGKLLGTLSYGTRTRAAFSDDETTLMRAVSDQVAAALERFLYVRELQRVNEDLKQFAYGVSHDLQEPTRTILSYSQLLLRTVGKRLNEDERRILDFVTAAAGQLQQTIRGLLAYSHASNANADRQALDIGEPVGDALVACRGLLDESHAEVTVDVPNARVRANRSQLAQVLQNLLSNAVKYRRPGETPRIAVLGVVRRGEIEMTVEDNGQGIAPEHLERIFQLFQRLHGREVPGTGIGLATSRRIVERHGGRIWVESRPGVGSKFVFTLPIVSP